MSIFERFRHNREEKMHRSAIESASVLFQVTEHGGELWLTYDSRLICPCSMLNDAPVDAVARMRELYVMRRDGTDTCY